MELENIVFSLDDVLPELNEEFELSKKIAPIRDRYVNSKSIYERWHSIRDYYSLVNHKIMKGKGRRRGRRPYEMPFHENFTPIEDQVWADIRRIGLPFYAQYPVSKYFIDFADPVNKIAIECDGKYHNDRIKEDKIRDNKLISLGWDVVRIDGWKTFKTFNDIMIELGFEDLLPTCLHDLRIDVELNPHRLTSEDLYRIEYKYFNETSEGFIYDMAEMYYNKKVLV